MGEKKMMRRKNKICEILKAFSTYFFNLSIIISFYVYLPALTKTERQNISSFGIV